MCALKFPSILWLKRNTSLKLLIISKLSEKYFIDNEGSGDVKPSPVRGSENNPHNLISNSKVCVKRSSTSNLNSQDFEITKSKQ